jgi:Ca2+-binding RTX toxin-like protein
MVGLVTGRRAVSLVGATVVATAALTLAALGTAANSRGFCGATAQSDNIILTNGNDECNAQAGNDNVYALAGNDRVSGDTGNDNIDAGAGSDEVDGGSGRDNLAGGSGNDRLFADDGESDLISCGRGVDEVDADSRDLVGFDCEVRA